MCREGDGAECEADHEVRPDRPLRREADTAEEAVAVASKVPAARLGGAIEVRPVATYW